MTKTFYGVLFCILARLTQTIHNLLKQVYLNLLDILVFLDTAKHGAFTKEAAATAVIATNVELL